MCRTKKALWIVTFLAAAFLPVHLGAQEGSHAGGQVASVKAGPTSLDWLPLVKERLILTVAGPEDFTFRQELEAGKSLSLSLFDSAGNRLPDGDYNWELHVIPPRGVGARAILARERETEDESGPGRPRRPLVQSGYFSIRDGGFVAANPADPVAADRPRPLRNVTANTQTISQDLVVQGNATVQGDACIGDLCTPTDTGGTWGLRLKDYFTGIYFEDVADGISAPNDWQIVANPPLGGGRFYLNEIDEGTGDSTTPFTIQSGAPSDSLFVRNNGMLGLGTSTPLQRLHVFENANVNSVVVLENPNTGSSAGSFFHAKSDVAYANFSTHGSGRTLSRFGQTLASWAEIMQGTGNGLIIGTLLDKPLILGTNNANRVHIKADGNVGIGTSTPVTRLEVVGEVLASGSVASQGFKDRTSGLAWAWYGTGDVARLWNLSGGDVLGITPTGNVGIGTLAPSSKLHVNGNVTVTGNFTATGTKSFAVVDPGDARQAIYYAALEGPEAGTYFRGTARTSGGEAVIELPDYFAHLTEPERLTVQLTPLGSWGQLYVAEKASNRLVVRLAPGGADLEFDYFVQGIRKGYLDYQVKRPNTLPVE